jgi:hypothetical protein
MSVHQQAPMHQMLEQRQRESDELGPLPFFPSGRDSRRRGSRVRSLCSLSRPLVLQSAFVMFAWLCVCCDSIQSSGVFQNGLSGQRRRRERRESKGSSAVDSRTDAESGSRQSFQFQFQPQTSLIDSPGSSTFSTSDIQAINLQYQQQYQAMLAMQQQYNEQLAAYSSRQNSVTGTDVPSANSNSSSSSSNGDPQNGRTDANANSDNITVSVT